MAGDSSVARRAEVDVVVEIPRSLPRPQNRQQVHEGHAKIGADFAQPLLG